MNTTGTDAARELAAREVAGRMAAAAAAWLDALDPAQHTAATGRAPSPDAESDAERRRWFYTPTDHGGLPLGAQRPAQQSLAHQLVATGLSTPNVFTRRRTIHSAPDSPKPAKSLRYRLSPAKRFQVPV